jgi:hypothetical protein
MGGTGTQLAGLSWQELGTDGVVGVWKNRSRELLSFANQTAVGSIVTSASLIGGFQNLLLLNELAAADILHIRAACTLVNNSGGASTMSIQTQIKGSGAAGTLAATVAISVASAATARVIHYDLWLAVRSLTTGSVLTLDGSTFTNFSATAANQIVLANTTAGPVTAVGCANGAVNGPYTFDLQVTSTVNNAATTGQCNSLMVEKISA